MHGGDDLPENMKLTVRALPELILLAGMSHGDEVPVREVVHIAVELLGHPTLLPSGPRHFDGAPFA